MKHATAHGSADIPARMSPRHQRQPLPISPRRALTASWPERLASLIPNQAQSIMPPYAHESA